MKKILKYQLLGFDNIIEMPEGAKVLSVQLRGNGIYLWVITDPDNKKAKRKFLLVGTGQKFSSDNLEFIGTVQVESFVWHVFEDNNIG